MTNTEALLDHWSKTKICDECLAIRHPLRRRMGVQPCPLHAAAPAMKAALEQLLAHRECPIGSPEAQGARDALRKATIAQAEH
jgi:hypothetical protein